MRNDREALIGADKRATTSLPADFLDRLVERVPQQLSVDAQLHSAQRICGRLLAVQRLQRDLSIHRLAAKAKTTPEVIQQIEWGMADPHSLTEPSVRELSHMLADSKQDIAWTKTLLAIAQGEAAAYDEGAVERAVAALEALDEPMQPKEQVLVSEVLETIAPAPVYGAQPFDPAQLHSEPEMFQVLRALFNSKADGTIDLFELWSAVHSTIRRGSAAGLEELLQRMEQVGLVKYNGRQANPDPDGEPFEYYAITSEGAYAYLQERERLHALHAQAEEAAQSQEAPKPPPLKLPNRFPDPHPS